MADLVRMVHRVTGVVARVDRETADRCAREWEVGVTLTSPPAPVVADPVNAGSPAVEPVVNTPPDAPAPQASRGAWAAYAESVGIEPGDLTKSQLREAVNDL